jgi:hypothetical protein
MTSTKRFTGRQITAMVAMLSAAIVLAPVSAVAATSVFTISDPAHPSYKAHVSSKGGLAVTAQDRTTGVRARVDNSGRSVVGDGSGALTVDGSVNVSGNVRAYSPAATWHFTNTYAGTYFDLTLPRTDAVNLTSLFASGDSTTQVIFLGIYAATVPTSSTSSCSGSEGTSALIWQGEAGGSAGAKDPISITFPTPLRSQPASGKKTCLYAYLNHTGNAILSASGYYGG